MKPRRYYILELGVEISVIDDRDRPTWMTFNIIDPVDSASFMLRRNPGRALEALFRRLSR